MGIDYYKVLKLGEGFTPDDLKRSYYKLSMRWHPDKNPLDRKKAESRFKQICEAYEVK
jgi:DnaJ family protein B protein 4